MTVLLLSSALVRQKILHMDTFFQSKRLTSYLMIGVGTTHRTISEIKFCKLLCHISVLSNKDFGFALCLQGVPKKKGDLGIGNLLQ